MPTQLRDWKIHSEVTKSFYKLLFLIDREVGNKNNQASDIA